MSIQCDIYKISQLRFIYMLKTDAQRKKIGYLKTWKSLSKEEKQLAAPIDPAHRDQWDFSIFQKKWNRVLREFQQNELKKAMKSSGLDPKVWTGECVPINELNGVSFLIYNKAIRTERLQHIVKLDNDSISGQEYLVFHETYESEAFAFLSIFQHTTWDFDSLQTVSNCLKRYFRLKHDGRSPNKSEFDALRQRYYNTDAAIRCDK